MTAPSLGERHLAWIASHLPPGAVRVAVVTRDEGDLTTLSAAAAPGSDLRGHRVSGDPDALHEQLSVGGRHDLVVDLAQGPGTAARVRLLLPHGRRGGLLLVLLPRAGAARDAVLAVLDDVRRLRDGGLRPPARSRDRRTYPERDAHALAASVDAAEVEGQHLVLTMAVATWAVVREARFDALLDLDPALGRVVHREPAELWKATAPFAGNRGEETPVGAVQAPQLSLRSFADVVCVRGNVARRGEVVLPETFRNPVRRRPRTPLLAEWLPGSVLDPEHPEPEPLPGAFLHADNILRGHFGHAVTEQLSHLWAWERALVEHPDLQLLVDASRQPVAEWELLLLEAAGVPRERVHVATGPVLVERLLASTPAYAIGHYAHPVLRRLHHRVGAALEHRAPADGGTDGERLFLTRRGSKRACRNQDDVEALLARHGFTVLAPEELSLPEQVARVRRASVVGGFGGSGLFHPAFSDRPTPMLALTSDNYPLANERMLAALHGHPLTVVRGVPDLVAEGFSEEAFHSPFVLDLDDLVVGVERTLAHLR
ncbi:hypothetical protein BH11ACT8_BH11ACT8_21890 [soil metagenome]